MWCVRPTKPSAYQNLCYAFQYFMTVKLLTEHHLEFPSLKRGCTGSSESTLVKLLHCRKSHVTAHLIALLIHLFYTIHLHLLSILIHIHTNILAVRARGSI